MAFRNLLSGALAEAADQVGAGRILTYPANERYSPLVGIDDILVAGGTAEAVDEANLPGQSIVPSSRGYAFIGDLLHVPAGQF